MPLRHNTNVFKYSRKSCIFCHIDSVAYMTEYICDILQRTSNLFFLGFAMTSAFPLCQGRGSLQHILSSCPKALAEGCNHWHHDQILRASAEVLSIGISPRRQHQPAKPIITFVSANGEVVISGISKNKAGEKEQHCSSQAGGAPGNSTSGQTVADHSQFQKLSQWPRWDQISFWYQRQWSRWPWQVEDPVEISCRSFAGQSPCRALKALGIRELHSRRAVNKSQMLQRERLGGCGLGGSMNHTSWELIIPGWVTWMGVTLKDLNTQ